MSPELSHILSVSLITTGLLSIGALAGYFAARRETTQRPATPNVATGYRRPYNASSIADDRTNCAAEGRHAAEQSQQLFTLAAAQQPRTPADVTEAIRCLNDFSKELAARLDKMAAARQSGSSPRSAVQGANGEAFAARTLSLPIGSVSHPGLTHAEIIEFTGATMSDTPEEVSEQRYPYHCLQTVAPWPDLDQAPGEGTQVRCNDISIDGISFYWPDIPDFNHVLISLGQGSTVALMAAEVMQHKAVFKFGQVQYLVGCRFLKRIDKERRLTEITGVSA